MNIYDSATLLMQIRAAAEVINNLDLRFVTPQSIESKREVPSTVKRDYHADALQIGRIPVSFFAVAVAFFAIGVSALPHNALVELQMTVEIEG